MHGILPAFAALLAGVIARITARAAHRENRYPAVGVAARSQNIVAPSSTRSERATLASLLRELAPEVRKRPSGRRSGRGRDSTPAMDGPRPSKPCVFKCTSMLNRRLMTNQAGTGMVPLGKRHQANPEKRKRATEPQTASADSTPGA